MAAARTESRVSLDRTTEQEGIVVDEGYCNLEDPFFADAADRLALLELEELETSSKTGSGSTRSLNVSSQSESSNPLKSRSSKSLTGKRSCARSTLPPISGAAYHQQASADLEQRALPARVDTLSVRSSGSLPPGSPFGKQEFQNSLTPKTADARLKAMGLDDSLLSGLQSLSPDELVVYLQLSDELRRDGKGQGYTGDNASTDSSRRQAGVISTRSSAESEERLDAAVKKLKSLLPKSAVARLQSHASYGLIDVIQSQPLTPPSTPTSTATNTQ